MSSEIELKYSMPETLSPETVFESITLHSEIKEIKMKSTYFDTEENLLGKLRASLRNRLENNTSVFTIKTSQSKNGALATRGEWQVEAETFDDAFPLLLEKGAPKEILAISMGPLKTIAEFEFVRKCAQIKTEDFSAELCVDIGYLSPDGVKKTPLREVEIELIAGDVSALGAFGKEFSRKLGLTPQSLSKLSRARNLK